MRRQPALRQATGPYGDAGSLNTDTSSLFRLATNTRPVPGSTATPNGFPPTGIVAVTWLLAPLMTLTVSAALFVMKTLPVACVHRHTTAAVRAALTDCHKDPLRQTTRAGRVDRRAIYGLDLAGAHAM